MTSDPPPATQSRRLFISYARRDARELAIRLHADLTAQGHAPWLDTSEIDGGASWTNDIEHAIDSCDVLLALLSQGSYASEICRAEQLRARRKNKHVIPIQVQSDTDRPIHLEGLNYRDFSDLSRYAEMFDILLNDILTGETTPLPSYLQRTTVTNADPLPPHFLPRPQVIETLRGLLMSDTSDRRIGITALHGMGGIGKSVMAAALCHDSVIQDAYPDGVIWVKMGAEPGSLTLKLREVGKALGDALANYESGEEAAINALRQILPKKAALIVVDDVWQSDHLQPFIVENAPRARIIFTTRDAGLVTALGASRYQLDALSDDEARQLLAQWVSISPDSLPTTALDVMQQCGNLPLALALCGAQVRDGTTWSDLLDALREADLEFLNHPYGSIMKSLKVSIDALERENKSFAAHYHELAVFPEDVAVPEAAILTLWLHTNGLNERSARQLLTKLANKAMLRTTGEAPSRLVELHDLQYVYLRQALGNLNAVHNELIEAYRKKCNGSWHQGPNDGYFFERLASHLHAAGRQSELYALLTDAPQWMEVKFAACVGDSAYVKDLELAIGDFHDPLTPEHVITLAKLWAARQVVNARVDVYTDTDVKTLVYLGRVDEAKSHVALRTGAKDQINGLLAIHEALVERGEVDKSFFDYWFAVISKLDEPILHKLGRRDITLALARSGYLADAVRYISEIEFAVSQAIAYAEAAVFLRQQGNQEFQTLLDKCREIVEQTDEPRDRAKILTHLAQSFLKTECFKDADRVIDEALSELHALDNFSDEENLVEHIAIVLAQIGRFDEAIDLTEQLAEWFYRYQALIKIAELYAQAGQFNKAIDLASSIETRFHNAGLEGSVEAFQAEALSQVALVLFREGHRSQAIELINRIEHAFTLQESLGEIASLYILNNQIETGMSELARVTNGQARPQAVAKVAMSLAQIKHETAAWFFKNAIETRQMGSNTIVTDRAWGQVASSVAKVGFFTQGLQLARAITTANKAEVLGNIAAIMAEVENDAFEGVIDEALKEAQKIWWPLGSEGTVITPVVVALTRIGRIDEGLQLARRANRLYDQVGGLASVAAAMTKVGDQRADETFSEAILLAGECKETFDRDTAFTLLALAMSEVGRIDEGISLVKRILHIEKQAGVLSSIAVILYKRSDNRANSIFDEALTKARGLQSYGDKETALGNIALDLARVGRIQESLSIIKAFKWPFPESVNIARIRGGIGVTVLESEQIVMAFQTLGTCTLGDFIEAIASWVNGFEKLQQGLFMQVLQDVLQICGWFSQSWHTVASFLTDTNDPPDLA